MASRSENDKTGAMLGSLRRLMRSALCRWPRLYTAVRRTCARAEFALGIPHEGDFRLFSVLDGEDGLFVDVGANAGQSARSLRIFNRSLSILSFEPNRALEADLDFTRRLLGPSFEYRMIGLSDAPGTIALFVPRRRAIAQTAWATADRALLEKHRRTIEAAIGGPFEISETTIEVVRFDDLNLRPSVIKIDVEGSELSVLHGMQRTLRNDGPLVLLESNGHSPEAARWLVGLGYTICAYDPRLHSMFLTESLSGLANFFACTPYWLDRFQRQGMLHIAASPRQSEPSSTDEGSAHAATEFPARRGSPD